MRHRRRALVLLAFVALVATGPVLTAAQDATPAAPADADGVRPVALFIERVGVFHPVEPTGIVDGAMQDPPSSVVVAWYEDLAALGEASNVVMAGRSGTLGILPGVFGRLAELAPGDRIELLGEDERVYAYAVVWVESYDFSLDTPQIQEIVGETDVESLTLLTGAGTADDPYVVVRAERAGAGAATPEAGAATPTS